jgi:hypothetical protein
MKKVILFIVSFICVINANAQFEEGKIFIGPSISGLNLCYNGSNDLQIGVGGQLGYLFADNFMLLGTASYEHNGNEEDDDLISAGAGFRYYIIQNGLYLALNGKWIHSNHNYNDIMPGVEVGYAFFISHTCTIEPAVYYYQSFKNHKDYSTIGLRIGFGIYI